MYEDDPEAASDMVVSERSHARVLTQLRGGDSDDQDVLRRSAVDARRWDISMRSQREAYQREITLEERELRDDHHEGPRGGARHDGARRARA